MPRPQPEAEQVGFTVEHGCDGSPNDATQHAPPRRGDQPGRRTTRRLDRRRDCEHRTPSSAVRCPTPSRKRSESDDAAHTPGTTIYFPFDPSDATKANQLDRHPDDGSWHRTRRTRTGDEPHDRYPTRLLATRARRPGATVSPEQPPPARHGGPAQAPPRSSRSPDRDHHRNTHDDEPTPTTTMGSPDGTVTDGSGSWGPSSARPWPSRSSVAWPPGECGNSSVTLRRLAAGALIMLAVAAGFSGRVARAR